MAKAKKETTDKAPAAPAEAKAPGAAAKPKAAAAKKAAASPTAAAAPAKPAAAAKKAPPTKASKPAGAPAAKPLIDTDLAASAAASMVLNRGVLGGASTPDAGAGSARESASFRQLKESLSKPGGASNLGGILGTGPIEKKKAQSHGPDRQVGRNQTFGADVNRASVPRRTGGG